jgi:DNA-binding response OmpR family regulator
VHAGRAVVAEDDAEMRRLVARALRRDGWEVSEASNGSELLELLEWAGRLGDPVDLVVTDVRMPGVSGLQALDWLRRVRDWSAPIIVITAFGDQRTHSLASQLGAQVLDKPFELDELRRLARAARQRGGD